MKTYACTNAACPEHGKPVQSKTDFVYCGDCATQLAEVATAPALPQDPRFVEAVKSLELLMGTDWNGSYQKQVTGDLLGRAPFFRDDFIDEMKKAQERKKFAGKGVARSSDAGKLCVDNAIKVATMKTVPKAIAGEKFTFEVPYLVGQHGFQPLKGLAEDFSDDFDKLAGLVTPGRFYLVVAKPPSQTVGHMVVITLDQKGAAFLTDAQKLSFSYGTCKVVAWIADAALNKPALPFHPIDLKVGKVGGGWVNK